MVNSTRLDFKSFILMRRALFPAFLLLFFAFSTSAHATSELDRKYALESVGLLRSLDNVDGLFADYVASAYRDYFSRQSRFKLQDLSKADDVLARAKLPYGKIIYDREILSQLARATRAESIIRTTIQKEGKQYRFTLEWLLSPQMELLSSDHFVLQENPEKAGKETLEKEAAGALGLGDLRGSLDQALDRMISKVPFVAQVTGRDNQSVTFDIGANADVKKGDTLLIATLDEVKKHPLLKSVVDWRLSAVGRVEIEEADERIAFGKVIEEESGRKIGRYQKVVQIMPTPVGLAVQSAARPTAEEETPDEPPRLGWISGGLGAGSFTRQLSSESSGLSGTGLFLIPRADLQLWLNREWFTEFGFGYGFSSYSQNDLATGAATAAGSVSASMSAWRFNLGYSYLVNGNFFGPKGWVRMGYQSATYTFPVSVTEQTTPIGFKAFFFGVGGDLPIRSNWSATLNIDFGLLPSAAETTNVSGSVNSSSQVSFFMGALYRYAPKIAIRGGLEITANNAEFQDGAALSQKTVTFAPSLIYYF
ncbi:MAG TPA: hypothetical protein VJB59_16310 [Bdellovibrionota bacterium]|nr:hypothetical protein [Bdellovibrionota bacterium]